jgi:hypothetical protein
VRGIAETDVFGWPEEDEVAFLLVIDSRGLGEVKPKYLVDDSYIFCFGTEAFGALWFEWDEDQGPTPNSFSRCLASELGWDHVARCIEARIRHIEGRVPPPPQATG